MTILKAENISKQYRLGNVGTGTLSHDLNRFWHKITGKEDPYLKVGAVNDRSSKSKEEYVWALQNINFEIKQGEVLGIIGKNGAGKSTLLKILSRVTGPTTGVIKSKGKIASLLEVGTGFHPELTGRENIFLNGAILGMTRAEITSKLDEIINFSGCELYIDTPVKRYSSGMTVRLAFAVAAHLEPDILVIDEVLAVGDAEFQKKAIGKMQDISKGEGRTILFVSHNMAAVQSLCTRGMVLGNGLNVFEGTAEAAVDFYLKKATSSAGISLLSRTDRMGNGKIRLKNIIFLNRHYDEIHEIISGQTLLLKIEIQKNSVVNFSDLIVAVNIQDNFENYVLSFISDEMDATFTALNEQDFFYLKIPNIYLRGGLYHIRVLLFEKDTRPENFLDVIEYAVDLTVLPGDLWKTGKVNRNGHSAIIPAYFEFQK